MPHVMTGVPLVAAVGGRDRKHGRSPPAPVSALPPAPTKAPSADAGAAREVFEKRILPIFKSPDPPSCVQCRRAGVDLKHYLRPPHEETFRLLESSEQTVWAVRFPTAGTYRLFADHW